jgi:uncharacterized membrane protein (UPF0136 family)
LTWLLVGMVFGMWLGITGHMNYANSHAHLNLLGFVVSVLFGLLHWAYPGLAKSRLAVPQFLTYQAGAILLVTSKVLVEGGTETLFLPIGALVTLAGAAMMLYLFAAKSQSSMA